MKRRRIPAQRRVQMKAQEIPEKQRKLTGRMIRNRESDEPDTDCPDLRAGALEGIRFPVTKYGKEDKLIHESH